MKERFTLRAAVYLLLLKGDEILLLRRYQTGWQDGNYSLVAGHLDGNERVTDAMAREAKEEACISVRKEDLRVTHVMHRKAKNAEYIDFFLVADTWEGELNIGEPDKCDELKWFPLASLPSNIVPGVKEAIEHYRAGVTFSESGWNGDAI